MHVLYLETMPWHVQFFLHTMKVHVNGLRKGTFSILHSHHLMVTLRFFYRQHFVKYYLHPAHPPFQTSYFSMRPRAAA